MSAGVRRNFPGPGTEFFQTWTIPCVRIPLRKALDFMQMYPFSRIASSVLICFCLLFDCNPGEPPRSNRIKENPLYLSPQELQSMLRIRIPGEGLYSGYRHILWKDEREMKDGIFEFILEKRNLRKNKFEFEGEYHSYAGNFQRDRLEGKLVIEFFLNDGQREFQNYIIRLYYRNGICYHADFVGQIGKKMPKDYKLETDDSKFCDPERLAEYSYRKWDRERVGREP